MRLAKWCLDESRKQERGWQLRFSRRDCGSGGYNRWIVGVKRMTGLGEVGACFCSTWVASLGVG